MLSDKQSLILTIVMVAGIFTFGILEILDNFIVLTILTLIFSTVVINLILVQKKSRRNPEE
ncbi:hypothetical protein Q4566_07485 [Tamlana sp. 2_MG-2023]|uniref:hypothetical protein n=1 Tax=unclassified Tamlana TaxID=2614803 RepID=UPI0026E29D64|nr:MULTISPECIES: hypothetical protein [unclassified Tamlana]MDO6760038.1 hypothetical protein [Tamlana sp. 2_MG-2023]MDO6790264.1 hypothetical protein [Tamlana sp. 1_MG-2023]